MALRIDDIKYADSSHILIMIKQVVTEVVTFNLLLFRKLSGIVALFVFTYLICNVLI